MDLIKLSELLTRRKKELRMTDKEIAGKAGVSRPYWIALRTGKNPKTNKPSRPSYDVIACLITALELDFNSTMELSGYQPPEMMITSPSSAETVNLKSYNRQLFCGGQLALFNEQLDAQNIDICRELLKNILNDANPIKIRTLLSFLEWLQQVPDETFGLQESVSMEPLSHELVRYVIERDGYKCSMCGSSDTELFIQHVIPLSEGGSNDPDNLITVCENCRSDFAVELGK